ncbi:uncharacterized protein LOC133920096 [Phragmites australis]|uniref:uncharacterized protein LOC133920096 n=1 Tax=Phragmites australis TaxID=29695 RepID=UPI002D7940FC|nr:uncharacterized protein LOC133920096 [Phragmites australis]XP_062220731.1 uncharacterized protein LOC133920096 [Phragmites australis]
MSSKVMITYKRKRVTSRVHTADDTVLNSSSAASSSSSVVVSSLPPKLEAHAENNEINKDNFPTSIKHQGVCKSMQQNIKEELAKQSTCEPEKGQKELQLCESLPQKEHPEICCATILSTAGTHDNNLQCTDDTNNPIPVSSSVCDPMHVDGMTNCTEGSNTCALVDIHSHQEPKDSVRLGQCKNRFSPLLTFRRRVKKKINLDKPAEENCSPDNDKQCSTLTCSPPSLQLNATPLLRHIGGKSSDIEDKVATVGRNTGLSINDEHLIEQKSSNIIKSSVQHIVPSLTAEVVNPNMTLEHDVTPVSKFTDVQDARVEDSSKTLPGTIEVPKVIDVKGEGHGNRQTSSLQSPRQKINVNWSKPASKSVAEDLLESQGSTKNVTIIVLDDDIDERGKELEHLEVLDQGVQNKNKSALSLGLVDLNCAELQQEGLLHLDDSSIQRMPDQDLFGNARKQMSQPIERMFFTKEKDAIHGKQQQHEGSSTMHTPHSNFFDLTPPWNTGSFKGPRSLPSELKFRIMDKVPEFNLDLSLDSLQDSSVSTRRSNKLFPGGTSSGSRKLTEKLGTYSYKRHSAPWSEEELDFLWIGVRRYGINNWNAMLRDTRLRFSNSRMPEDLAKQWDKEQKKLLGVDLLQSIKASALGPAPPPLIAEDYPGSASCSGCSKSPFLAAQTDLSLGDVYLRNARASERGQHHLSSLGMLNLHGIDGGRRNLSPGGFPGASSSHGRTAGRRRRASKFHNSYYESKSHWFQEPSERAPQLLPINQPQISSLPQWLTKDAETGTSRINPEMWPSMLPPGHFAGQPRDSLRAVSLFSDDVKPHFLPDASLKRTMKRNADWRSFSKRLFRTGDALDLNQEAAAIAGPNASDTGASSEETVSDS